MEINIKLLKYHVDNLGKIKTYLMADFKYYKYVKLVDNVLDETGILYNPYIQRLPTYLCISLTTEYALCVLKLKEELYPKLEKVRSNELAKLVFSLNTRIYNMIDNNSENCKECDSFLVRHRNEWFCQDCKVFKGKIFLAKDEELDDDIKQNKSNISKHFDVNLNRIYGIIDKKSALPKCALRQLRRKLDDQGFDLTREVNFTFAIINQLKQLKYIDCTCKNGTHEIASQKKQANYIISEIYPEVKIPRLSPMETITTKNTFLSITAASQQLFPGKYSTAYQYTLHRILNINYGNRENVKYLSRFIYPQKQTSFNAKDKKLKEINDVIHCFKEFQPIPQDIYINISNYRINKLQNRY